MFFYYYYFEEINVFYFNLKKNPEVGVIIPLHSRDIGCLARDEFLVIREGYHMLIYIFTVSYC